MEKNQDRLVKRRKHKSQFFVGSKAQGRMLKQKRISCMLASQLQQIEESKQQIVNYLIQQILTKVYESLERAKIVTARCCKQIQQKVQLVDKLEIYNMSIMPQQTILQIKLQEQPKTQHKYKVMSKKQKNQQNNNKQILNIEMNKTNSSKSGHKFLSKQKLFKITNTLAPNTLGPNQSNKSIKSVKSNLGNTYSMSSYRFNKSIEQEQQNQKQKQRRQKQQIIKKLMRQYQYKLKQIKHHCPQPLIQQYRSFFTQPQTKQQQDLRTSFLHLRSIKQSQQKINFRKTHKQNTSSSVIQTVSNKQSNSNKQNLRTTKLPAIYKSNANKKQQSISLFVQGQNGQIIKIKNNQRVDTLTRDYSISTYQNFNKKPQQTPLKQISNIFKVSYQNLKNDKIKDQNSFINQNASLVSTLCQSIMDQQVMEKSLMQSFVHKKGVIIKKHTYSHRPSMSVQLQAVKLPSIMTKKR